MGMICVLPHIHYVYLTRGRRLGETGHISKFASVYHTSFSCSVRRSFVLRHKMAVDAYIHSMLHIDLCIKPVTKSTRSGECTTRVSSSSASRNEMLRVILYRRWFLRVFVRYHGCKKAYHCTVRQCRTVQNKSK